MIAFDGHVHLLGDEAYFTLVGDHGLRICDACGKEGCRNEQRGAEAVLRAVSVHVGERALFEDRQHARQQPVVVHELVL